MLGYSTGSTNFTLQNGSSSEELSLRIFSTTWKAYCFHSCGRQARTGAERGWFATPVQHSVLLAAPRILQAQTCTAKPLTLPSEGPPHSGRRLPCLVNPALTGTKIQFNSPTMHRERPMAAASLDDVCCGKYSCSRGSERLTPLCPHMMSLLSRGECAAAAC